MISCCWDYHGSHNGGNVEVRPCEHFTKDYIDVEVISYALYSVFHRDSSLVIDGLRLISIVVGLDKEPSLFGKLIKCIDRVSFPLNDHTLIPIDSSNDVVDWCCDSLVPQSLACCGIGRLFLQNFPQKPACGNSIIFDYANEVFFECFGCSCVDVDGKCSIANSSQCENSSHNSINCVEFLTVLIILDVHQQFREEFPHLEVQIPSVDYFSLLTSDNEASACRESREFIHEIEEEYLFERIATELCQCINFSNKILILEFILSVPFDSIIEGLGNGQQVKVFHESVDWFSEVSSHWSPSNNWRVIQ